MDRLIGPILHLRAGPADRWSFAVGMLVRGAPPAPTLTFPPASGATVDGAPRSAGQFHGGEWLFWNVSIPRGARDARTSYTITGLTEGAIPVDHVVVPGKDQAPRLAFFSCNGVQDSKDWTTQPDMERLWKKMRERHGQDPAVDGSGGPYHVLVGGGDQVYCDAIWQVVLALRELDTWDKRKDATVSAQLRAEIETAYGTFYERWRRSWFGDLHMRVPGVYTWDDHDIFDGWGSYDEALQASPVFQAIVEKARLAFRTCQLGGGPAVPGTLCVDPKGQHFLQVARFPGQLDLLVLDLRSGRTAKRVMAEEQWTALHRYLTARAQEAPPAPHLVVVSSIPLVYLNFASTESFLDWVPWRQDLEDDLRDQWESPDHQQERARLIMTLMDHAAASHSRVSVLSGDVHVGSRGRIVSRRPQHLLPSEAEAVIHQLTSSAIVYPPPGALALAGMRVVAKEGPAPIFAVSQVETEVVQLGAKHFLLGARNWLSLEPDEPWSTSRTRLWARWIADAGSVEPPIVIHQRP